MKVAQHMFCIQFGTSPGNSPGVDPYKCTLQLHEDCTTTFCIQFGTRPVVHVYCLDYNSMNLQYPMKAVQSIQGTHTCTFDHIPGRSPDL